MIIKFPTIIVPKIRQVTKNIIILVINLNQRIQY